MVTTPQLILAPLQGFTDAVFRNTYQRHFQGLDEAVAPFVASLHGQRIKAGHLRELLPGENRSLPVVPQILSNHAEGFITLARALFDMGYGEVNWNLGCPFPQVANKGRGSGLLPYPERIDAMLDNLFAALPGRLSIKTRLGRYHAGEMEHLLPVFNRYPLARIIIHPRTGAQRYGGTVDLAGFGACLQALRHPVIYNGDLTDPGGFTSLAARFPSVSAWMLGRGVIADPFLPETIKGACPPASDRIRRFADFHADLVESYRCRFSGPAHVLDRMKGFWQFFASGFSDGTRLLKHIRKCASLEKFGQVVTAAMDQAGANDLRSQVNAARVALADCAAWRNHL